MLLYNEEQQVLFLDVLETVIYEYHISINEKPKLLIHLRNDIFKNSNYNPTLIPIKNLYQIIQKIDVDVYLVYLFNLLYDLTNDPKFNTKAITKESFIKKIDNLLDSLEDSTKEKIRTNKNFHKPSKGKIDELLSGSEKLLEESQKQFEKIQKTGSSIFSNFMKRGE
jgi:hypothetical protein